MYAMNRVFACTVSTLLLALSCSALPGCAPNPQVIWSTTAPSPDGLWVASVQTKMWSGPGIGTVGSMAYLARSSEADKTIEILTYREGANIVHPELKWQSPKELLILIPADTSVDFQAIKCAGIAITLQHLPRDAGSHGAG